MTVRPETLRPPAGDPGKTREIVDRHFDSTVWNDFAFRDGDVIVASYAKSGTTWMQQIVGQLIFAGDPAVSVAKLSPWFDARMPPKRVKHLWMAAQTHRRFLKSHLPADALRFGPGAKYIHIARDGRDVIWSMHNHHRIAHAAWCAAHEESPEQAGPAIPAPEPDPRVYFRTWLDRDGAPFWPFWDHIRSWWARRVQPEVHQLHFEALGRDLPGEMRRVADFLAIDVDPAKWPAMVEHCTLDWMKRNAAGTAPVDGIFGGIAGNFINMGSNGRWRDVLTAGDIADYEARALAELGPECAHWLATGEVV